MDLHSTRARWFAASALLVMILTVLSACGGSSAGGASDSGNEIKVTETEYKIEPADVSAKTGTITFDIHNDGTMVHNLAVDVNGNQEVSPNIDPGKSEKWSVEVDQAGTYKIYCEIPGHEQLGMVGSLDVTS